MTGDDWVRIVGTAGFMVVAVVFTYFWFRGGKG